MAAVRLRIADVVREQFPDYRALVIYAEGLTNRPSSDLTTDWLRDAAAAGLASLGNQNPSSHPHVAAWRAAYSAFGAKPKKYPCSVEALLKRVVRGEDIPAINTLVDAYNAVSLQHVLPVGGENWDALASDLQLLAAVGDEVCDIATPEDPLRPGEIVWCDARGVTSRRWNWRQSRRTQLTLETTRAYFVLDRLPPMAMAALDAAADDLAARLERLAPGCQIARALLG